MTEFETQIVESVLNTQKEVLGRLSSVETLLRNGLTKKIEAIDRWVMSHPQVCPLERSKATFVLPVVVAVLTAVALKAIDVVFKVF
jgi:hypothetical protein